MSLNKKIYQSDLVLKINQNHDRNIINIDDWENFLNVLCVGRGYQKEAIKTAIIYLASGLYGSINDLAKINFNKNDNIKNYYETFENFSSKIQLPNKLTANIDLATGTGKSYVIFAIAIILLAKKVVKRVLILCPSLTIEKGLKKKFDDLLSDSELNESIPNKDTYRKPKLTDANSTIKNLDICIENIHSVYDKTQSSIKDSFKNGGEDTLILNDESHHIYNVIKNRSRTLSDNLDIKEWKKFLLNENYNFKYILGFTGTAYIENEYFVDVIYRYSLRVSINRNKVKHIDYVVEDDTNNINDKFQKIYENHVRSGRMNPKLKPLSLFVTNNINGARVLQSQFIDFLIENKNMSKEEAHDKTIIVTSHSDHKLNIKKLETIDDKDNPAEWIFSVSMLTEGWDVKNVFQIIPWEDKAFNSKLLIAQVLGRGLRIPKNHGEEHPRLRIFNHRNWGEGIKTFYDSILENDSKITSSVKQSGEWSKYNFVLRNLEYDNKEGSSKQTYTKGAIIDYSKSSTGGVNLVIQEPIETSETTYSTLNSQEESTVTYKLSKKFKNIKDIAKEIFFDLQHKEWLTIIKGMDGEEYTYDNPPPKETLENFIKNAMRNNNIKGDELSLDNERRIKHAFSTVFREKVTNKSLTWAAKKVLDINTENLSDETKSINNLGNKFKIFYPSKTGNESKIENQNKILFDLIEEKSKHIYEMNGFDFKTPLNIVFSSSEPEFKFISKLCEYEISKEIEGWIKSRDRGFYSIKYSMRKGTHQVYNNFNPDFFIKRKIGKMTIIHVVETKAENDKSDENIAKYHAAIEHFKELNKWLKNKTKIKEKYVFNFLWPSDFDNFFDNLKNKKEVFYESKADIELKQ